jgi:hypothetical protein
LKPDWLSENIKNERANLRILHDVAKNVNSTLLPYYKMRLKKYRQMINASKRWSNDNYVRQNKNKIKATWNVINSECKLKCTKEDCITQISIDGRIVKDKSEIADLFNTHFIDNVKEMVTRDLPALNRSIYDKNYDNNRTFNILPVTQKQVLNIINKLPNKQIAGLDGIPYSVIKFVGNILTRPLTQCINSSFEDYIFPNELKLASVYPLYKSGPKDCLDNYRIIAKQSAFAKIFELCVRPQIQLHRSNQGLYSKSQHGFTSGKSINTALFDFFKPIYNAMDRKLFCVVITLYVKKAFDSLDHVVILDALQKIGCSQPTLNFFNSYLSGRQQCVEIRESKTDPFTYKSALKNVEYGIQQGSCLSPELYDIATLDLIDHISCANFIQFADDLNLSVIADNLEDLNNKTTITVTELQNWCEKKRLILNPKKDIW